MYRLNPFCQRLRYSDVPQSELRQYFVRFQSALAERTTVLAELVREDDAFALWMPALTRVSLGPLSNWFAAHVQTRPKSPAELFEARSTSLSPATVRPLTLTEWTFSVAADVGMYFGQVLTHAHPQLQWKLLLGSKNNADYGQPVLGGFRAGGVMNPIRVATVVAWKAAEGEAQPHHLCSTFDTWRAYLDSARPIETDRGRSK